VAEDGVDERMEKVESSPRSTPRKLTPMGRLITAEWGRRKSFSRLGQGTGAVAQTALTWPRAKNFPWVEGRPGCSRRPTCGARPVGVVGAIVLGTSLSSYHAETHNPR